MKVIFKQTGQLGEIPDDKFDPAIFSVPQDPAPVVPDQPEAEVRQPSFLSKVGQGAIDIGKSMISPFVKTGKNVLAAGYELARGARSMAGDDTVYYDPEKGKVENPFLNEKEMDRAVNNTAEEIVRNSAGIASWAVPFGKGANIITKALLPGAAVGSMQTASEEGTTLPEIVGGGIMGAGTSGLLYGAGKVFNKSKDGISKAGEAIEEVGTKSRTGNVTLKSSLSGAGEEKQVVETLRKYGIKGTPQERYEMLQPTVEKISKSVDDILSKNSKPVTMDEIQAIFDKKASSLVKQGDITLPEAQQAFKEYLNSVSQVDDQIFQNGASDTQKLFALKKDVQAATSQVASAMKKAELKSTLTPTQKSMKAIRDTLDEVITTRNPEVKNLTMDQSRLYEAVNSLGSQRKTVPTERIFGITVPKGATNMAKDKLGEAAEKTGSVVQKSANLIPEIPVNNLTGQVASRLPLIGENNGQEGLNNEQSQNNNEDVSNHLPDITSPKKESQTITGYTPEELFNGYMQAQQSGDTKNASILKGWYDAETKYQTSQKSDKVSSQVADLQASLTLANGLDAVLQDFKGVVGPVSGRIRSKNPYDTKAQDFNSQMVAVAQVIGKALEGGVLRAEDMPKYRAILPQITDTDKVAQKKIDNIKKLLEDQIKSRTNQNSSMISLPEITSY